MDQYELLAAILWTVFAGCIVGLIAGVVVAQHRPQRRLALVLVLVSILGILAFSFIGGFSIGRFTALFAVLGIGYVVAMGRGPFVVAGCLVGAGLLYLACSWLLTDLVLRGGIYALLFGAWAIPTYAVLAVAAFFWAMTKPLGSHGLVAPPR